MFAELSGRHGENEIAHLFQTDRTKHCRRREAGRLFFFEPEVPGLGEPLVDPRWLESLLESVARCVIVSRPIDKLDHKCAAGSSLSEVDVLPPTDQPWAINIQELRNAFEEFDEIGWYGAPREAGEGPYFWVEGTYMDRKVFLRILGRR